MSVAGTKRTKPAAAMMSPNDPKATFAQSQSPPSNGGISDGSCLAHLVLSAPLCYFVTPATTNLAVSTMARRSALSPHWR
jgi:hypothetical protein